MITSTLLALQMLDPALPTLVTDPILSQITASSLAVWILQRLKGAAWFSALTEDSGLLVKWGFAALAALITTAGISWTYDPTGGSLVVTGLTLAGVSTLSWAFLQSWFVQQLVYHGAVKPRAQN
jgi:hypothetical protein